uniref:Uncharacterized protein n=1 Tax=Pristionchus pacificus TaxID=54126 RepID=A0A2A6BLD2_PRIPA|eukprot:PDM66623.1 hypothetical protein PRIPAC_48040 [Pristionchus pacificus]
MHQHDKQTSPVLASIFIASPVKKIRGGAMIDIEMRNGGEIARRSIMIPSKDSEANHIADHESGVNYSEQQLCS